jgi:hypothetical protein
MTEAEWLECDDPAAMLTFLRGRISKRKCLLFGCACERRLWDQRDCEREKVEATERYADGEGPADDVLAALEVIGIDGVTLEDVTDMDPVGWAEEGAYDAADYAANVARRGEEDEDAWDAAFAAERAVQVVLLRDAAGDPFRPRPGTGPWVTPAVVSLAEAAYAERHSSSGCLDVQRLAVLADALEESGCADDAILSHLRAPGPHVRGCWVIDLLLGRE